MLDLLPYKSTFEEHRARYRAQIAYMDADLLEWAEKNGGKESLETGQRKAFAGRELGLIKLANYDDAALEYVSALENALTQTERENAQLRAQLLALKGEKPLEFVSRRDFLAATILGNIARIPMPLPALLVRKAAARQASIQFARNSQPDLF